MSNPSEKSAIRRSILDEAAKRVLEDANEAQTRLKIIDRILFELLDWTHDDVTPEERVEHADNTEFTDYSVRTVNSGLVIEAKRVGSSIFPKLPKRRMRLSALSRDHVSLWGVILKARDYALTQSLQFACITNGNSWIVFPASRSDSVPWLDSSAVIFDGIEHTLGSDWSEFEHLLSRDSVISASLELALLGTETDQVDDRRLKNFGPRAKEGKHNSIFELIREGVDIAFSDVTEWQDSEALKYCYVQTPDRQRFDSRIKMAVSRPDGVVRKRQLDAVSASGFEKSKKLITTSRSANSRSLALLVLGSVGAGKTTFLQYFRKVGALDYFASRDDSLSPKWIWIDFRDFSPGDDSQAFISDALFEYVLADSQLTDSSHMVRPAFRLEIEGLKRSLAAFNATQEQIDIRTMNMLEAEFQNKKSWAEKLLKYASTKAPIFIIVDNVDQILDLEKQSEIFNSAMALAGRVNSSVVVSLRETTFVQHRSTAIFNAFEFDSISIEPPPIAAVLSRRFSYLRVLYRGKKGSFEAENGATVNVGNIVDVVDLMQRSVLGTEVGNIIEVLAGGDVRMALKICRQFLEVGYTGPGKAFNTYKSTGSYVLPPHEALRSIILGNKPIYDESHSVIANPFDSRMGRSQKQLLRLFVMSGLVSQASNHSFDRMDGIEIARVLRSIGFGVDVSKKILCDLVEFRLARTMSFESPTINDSYAPTRLCGTILRHLIFDLTFLEAMMMDTFIAHTETWNNLKSLTDMIHKEPRIGVKMQHRIRRAETFYDYCETLYRPLLREAQRRGLSAEWCVDIFSSGRTQLAASLGKVLDSAKRNYPDAFQRENITSR